MVRPKFCASEVDLPRIYAALISRLEPVRKLLESFESDVILSCWFDSRGGIRSMWTKENRARYDRRGLRYPSDLTDEEWAVLAPLIPRAKRGGNKRSVDERSLINGLLYILSTGCQWRAIPKDFPPRSALFGYFQRWERDGTLERAHHALYQQCRAQAGRDESPRAAIIDSQSVKSAEKGGPRLTRRVATAARKSRERNATSLLIRSA